MSKKAIIYLIVNIPFTYLLFISFGWIAYVIVEGNPTYIIPFNVLLLLFSILTILLAIGFIKLLKIHSIITPLIAIIEIAAMYLLFWRFFQ
ncbi:MAG: hypothetical protein WDO19_00820 [Bacteroidota bacterium]